MQVIVRKEAIKMKLLVIGGAGYIGSHFVRHSLRAGHSVAVYDNLSTGHRQAVHPDATFILADLLHEPSLTKAIADFKPDAILHFAALALVPESVKEPAKYYKNNVEGVRILLDALKSWNASCPLIFSSTCAVFGVPEHLPISEDDPKHPISPYGRSKLMAEYLIEDYSKAYGMRAIALRYFNACGADTKGDIGEDHKPETHLIPNIIRSAQRSETLTIFGDDFDTKDGTCVRDYIHVNDLANAHLKAIDFLMQKEHSCFEAIHLGQGKGYSNLEIVQSAESILNTPINYRIGKSREGDPPRLFASTVKAQRLLKFTPQHSDLNSILSSAYKWHKNHPEGFDS